jgi:hypothetical protein
MNERLSESRIVRELAKTVEERITRRVVRDLQRMDVTLSGDDSGLKTTWDEVCVQIQYQESVHWEVYEETVRGLVEGYVDELPNYEAEAVWLQTQHGWDWDCEEPEDREAQPVVRDHIVEYIIQDCIYVEAGRWSNARIRAFLDRY